jgi:hypothetical protein
MPMGWPVPMREPLGWTEMTFAVVESVGLEKRGPAEIRREPSR